jgi:TIR domain
MAAPRIFLSHSRMDDAIATRLAGDLRAAGAEIWLDLTDVQQGDFMKRINEGLSQCDCLVLVLTPHSLSSPSVEMEVNAALNLVRLQRITAVIPFLGVPVDMAKVPPMWATLHYYDATADYASALAGLLRALGLTASANALAAVHAAAPQQPAMLNTAMSRAQAQSGATWPAAAPVSMPGAAGYSTQRSVPLAQANPQTNPNPQPGVTVPPYAAPYGQPPAGYAPASTPYGQPQQAPHAPAPNLYQQPLPQPLGIPYPVAAPQNPADWQAIVGIVLGGVGMIAWFLPICGFPITIAALVFGLLGMKSPARKTLAIIAVALAGLGLLLTVINAAIGAYLGVTGQL